MEPFGATVRVRYEPAAQAGIAAALGTLPGATVEPADVSLEDVFLAVSAAGGGAAPEVAA